MMKIAAALLTLALPIASSGCGFGRTLGVTMGQCRENILSLATGSGSTQVEILSAGYRPSGDPYSKYRQGASSGYVEPEVAVVAMDRCIRNIRDVHVAFGASGMFEVGIASSNGEEGYYLHATGIAQN